jgi:hypothetical protein
MNRKPVTSSQISSIGYNRSMEILEVEFNNGAVFQYSEIPEKIYCGLINASSIGSYFHRIIKLGNYSYSQVF